MHLERRRMKALHLAIAVITMAFFVAHAETGGAMSLRPQAVECTGTFCYTGVVTSVSKNRNFAFAEQNGQRHFLFVEDHFNISQGDVVAINGEFTLIDNGSVFKVARRVIKLNRLSLPQPIKVPISDLVHNDILCQRITTEGTLILARRDEIDASTIQLLVKDGATILNAAITDNATNAINVISLLGAQLRMTGVMLPPNGARQIISNHLSIQPDGLQIISPPPTDIFNVPSLNFDSPLTPGEIVRMDSRRFDGVVLATWDGNRIMLAGSRHRRVKATLALDDELPAVGQHVSVVGFPDTDLYNINLLYARCKAISGAIEDINVPKPISTTLRQLLTDDYGRPRINGYSHGRLLRISGTVLDIQPSLSLFSLNSDEITIPIDCSASPEAIANLETNSRVEVTVLAVLETESWRESIALPQTRGLKLILRSAQDINVISRPPWWTPARLTAAIITLLFAIVFIITANRIINKIVMRRKISERTRLAVELHDSLSQTLAGVACQIAAGHGAISEDPVTAKSLLKTAERMLESSRTELKNCLFDLRSDTVDDPDFTRAIEKTLTILNPAADISIRFNVPRSLMTDTLAHAVLCIIRELVANAIRHGEATRIRIAGIVEGKKILFSVRDNGSGFEPKRHPGPREGHFGLAGVHERLAAINGSFSITSKPGATRITANITLL